MFRVHVLGAAALALSGLTVPPALAVIQQKPVPVCLETWRQNHPGMTHVQAGQERQERIDLDQDGQLETRQIVLMDCPDGAAAQKGTKGSQAGAQREDDGEEEDVEDLIEETIEQIVGEEDETGQDASKKPDKG